MVKSLPVTAGNVTGTVDGRARLPAVDDGGEGDVVAGVSAGQRPSAASRSQAAMRSRVGTEWRPSATTWRFRWSTLDLVGRFTSIHAPT